MLGCKADGEGWERLEYAARENVRTHSPRLRPQNDVLSLIGELRTQSSTWYTVRKLVASHAHFATDHPMLPQLLTVGREKVRSGKLHRLVYYFLNIEYAQVIIRTSELQL